MYIWVSFSWGWPSLRKAGMFDFGKTDPTPKQTPNFWSTRADMEQKGAPSSSIFPIIYTNLHHIFPPTSHLPPPKQNPPKKLKTTPSFHGRTHFKRLKRQVLQEELQLASSVPCGPESLNRLDAGAREASEILELTPWPYKMSCHLGDSFPLTPWWRDLQVTPLGSGCFNVASCYCSLDVMGNVDGKLYDVITSKDGVGGWFLGRYKQLVVQFMKRCEGYYFHPQILMDGTFPKISQGQRI